MKEVARGREEQQEKHSASLQKENCTIASAKKKSVDTSRSEARKRRLSDSDQCCTNVTRKRCDVLHGTPVMNHLWLQYSLSKMNSHL
jgi:hypothetical protein